MTNDTVLTPADKDNFVSDLVDYGTDFVAPLYAVVESIEQAVMQSPEVRRLREDAGRLDFFIAEECQLQSLTLGNGTKFRLGWPDDGEAQNEWFTSPRAAIDAAIDAAIRSRQ